jgi:hypothetical protein
LFAEPTASVSAALPIDVLDRLIGLAARRGESVSQTTRTILMLALREPPQTPPTNPSK